MRVGHAFFSKERNVLRSFGFFFKRTLCSFAKGRCVHWVLLRSLHKNFAFFAIFYVLYKRMLHSLLSFTFLRKERKRMHLLLGFISCQKLEKRTQKKVACFKRTQKKDAFRTLKNAVPNPAYPSPFFPNLSYFLAVLRIRTTFVQIRIRLWLRGSDPDLDSDPAPAPDS